MNLMRRDNPALPEDYFFISFIAGLTPYLQSHVEVQKPTNMQQAIWYARRTEPACPPAQQQSKSYFPQTRRQVQFDFPKQVPAPPVSSSNNPANIIQQARL
jgi:hypothetical protein